LCSQFGWCSCIPESFVGHYRVKDNPGPALPGQDVVDAQVAYPFRVRPPPQSATKDMAQIFHRSTNFIARLSVYSAILVATLALSGLLLAVRAPYYTNQNHVRNQPIQFSHKHHVGDDGIDCRYCHSGVETSGTAGIPPTKTCMNCHSVLFTNSEYLEPVRASYRTNESIRWVKVHRLPDFVYFNHSIHVNKGVGCSSCHGKVNQMALVFQASPLQMQWCLDCHRNPERVLRPHDQVFNMDWKAPANQDEIGKKLRAEYNIQSTAQLQSCSTCHR
jgi:hypothetical protein